MPDGSLDPSFGTGGVVRTRGTTSAGWRSSPTAGSSRRRGHGPNSCSRGISPMARRTGRSGTGAAVPSTCSGGGGAANGVAIQPNGKIVTVGHFRQVGLRRRQFSSTCWRSAHQRGRVDRRSFEPATPPAGHEQNGEAVAIGPDGEIAIAGSGYTYDASGASVPGRSPGRRAGPAGVTTITGGPSGGHYEPFAPRSRSPRRCRVRGSSASSTARTRRPAALRPARRRSPTACSPTVHTCSRCARRTRRGAPPRRDARIRHRAGPRTRRSRAARPGRRTGRPTGSDFRRSAAGATFECKLDRPRGGGQLCVVRLAEGLQRAPNGSYTFSVRAIGRRHRPDARDALVHRRHRRARRHDHRRQPRRTFTFAFTASRRARRSRASSTRRRARAAMARATRRRRTRRPRRDLHVLGPRDRRGRQHRRDAGDSLLHHRAPGGVARRPRRLVQR